MCSSDLPAPKAEIKVKEGVPTPAEPVTLSTSGPNDPVVEEEVNVETKLRNEDPVMPFIVSFYSIGSGIDRGQSEKLLAFLDDFNAKNKSQVEFSEIHWGREGETDYCFPLTGLNDSQIRAFKSGVKEALKSAEHVHYLENEPCRKGR